MRKLLLTLLLLFSLGLAAKAETEELTPSLLNGNNTAYDAKREYTSTKSGLSYKMGAYINGSNFQQNKRKGCFFEVTANSKGVKITNIQLVGLSSKTASYFNAKASDSHLTVNVESAGKGTGSITGGTAVALNGDSFAPNNTFFSYYVTSSASSFTFSKIIVTYEDAAPAEKIELEDANLEVKAGEQELGSEAELDANTTISWNYNYTGEVANPDITYTYSVDGGEDVEGNEYIYTGEKDVVLTVKATSTNTVSKTVKLLKKYPTVCPEPVFSVEDGAEVSAGQVITVSCEGADIEWTVNDATITGTSYTITEEVGTQLTFYALAGIEGRNPSTGNIETLIAEKEITVTVVEATEALFDFIGGNTYGLTSQTNSNTYETALTEISNGIVTISFTGEHYRYWNNDKTLRVQADTKFTISVPDGFYITKIDITGTSASNVNTGTFNRGNWTPTTGSFDSSVIFSPTTTTKIETITVQYAKVPDPELDGDPIINVTHASKKGVLIVKYSFKIANHNGKPVEVTANVAGMEQIKFTDATPANAPARVAGESTAVIGTLRAEHADLVDASNINVNLTATLGGKEFFTRQATVTTTTGIEDVTVEGEGEAEYFNLQGLRVAQPEAGQLYIKRQAGKAVKVRF